MVMREKNHVYIRLNKDNPYPDDTYKCQATELTFIYVVVLFEN